MYNDIKTILYASDLGENTRPVFYLAVDLAKKYDAQIIFLHVIEPIRGGIQNWITPEELQEILSRTSAEAEARVNKRIINFFEEEMPANTAIKSPKAKVVRGRVTESILKTADEMSADLIIMGQHKRNILGEMIIGSSADKVVHHSKRPVIAVPIP